MAEYAVNTNQLRSNADRIAALQRELDSVAVRLGAMQLGSVLQIRASTALIGRVGDCKWAAAHQSDDLGRLARGLDDIALLYDNVEKNLAAPKTQAQADAEASSSSGDGESWWDKFWDGAGAVGSWALDIFGEGCGPVSILSGLFGLGSGDFAGAIKDFFSGGANILFGVGQMTEGATAGEWFDNLLGLTASNIDDWDDAVDDWINKHNFGKQTTTAGKAGVICQWAGYALSFLCSGVENYGEFDGDMGNARFWGETVIEGSVDIGLGIGAGIAAAAICPATWPAIAVGAVGVGAVWVANGVCEWITGGRDIGEVVSDFVCDGVEAAVEFAQDVGEAASDFFHDAGEAISDGVEAAWDGVCDWVGSWW